MKLGTASNCWLRCRRATYRLWAGRAGVDTFGPLAAGRGARGTGSTWRPHCIIDDIEMRQSSRTQLAIRQARRR